MHMDVFFIITEKKLKSRHFIFHELWFGFKYRLFIFWFSAYVNLTLCHCQKGTNRSFHSFCGFFRQKMKKKRMNRLVSFFRFKVIRFRNFPFYPFIFVLNKLKIKFDFISSIFTHIYREHRPRFFFFLFASPFKIEWMVVRNGIYFFSSSRISP